MPGRYAELLGDATRIRWPQAAWVSDVDAGFYVACYLRAWALETHWRRALRERFGERWFALARGRGVAARAVGARPAARTPTSCSPRSWARSSSSL